MILDASLKLFDYLIKLLEKRSEGKSITFNRYVQPAFQAAEIVCQDYLSLLHNVKRKIECGTPVNEIIRILEDGRIKNLPIRIKLRGLVGLFSIEYTHYLSCLPTFERGIFGILNGGLSAFEDGRSTGNVFYLNFQHYSTDIYKGIKMPHGHTLLDILYKFSGNPSLRSKDMIEVIDYQMKIIEAAWKDVVDGYAELASMSKNKKSLKKGSQQSEAQYYCRKFVDGIKIMGRENKSVQHKNRGDRE